MERDYLEGMVIEDRLLQKQDVKGLTGIEMVKTVSISSVESSRSVVRMNSISSLVLWGLYAISW
jgi:hypothetical protein